MFDKGREVQLLPGSNDREFRETRVRELGITVWRIAVSNG